MTLSQFGIPLFQDKGYFSKVQDKESERVSILRRLQFGVEAGATTTKANERERERELNRLNHSGAFSRAKASSALKDRSWPRLVQGNRKCFENRMMTTTRPQS